jgi:FMN phosphatase YigB (HAD superfamily)
VNPHITGASQRNPQPVPADRPDSTPVTVICLDYAGTLSADRIDHQLREKPVDPAAAAALHALHQSGITLLLASNTLPCEARWPALQQAGIDHLFRAALLSCPLGVRKPQPIFYALVLAAADCPASQVLFVGDNLDSDVPAPVSHGMRAALVRSHGLRHGESLPDGALLIRHVRELPALLETTGDQR